MAISSYGFTFSPYAKRDVRLASLIPNKRYPNQDALIKVELTEDDYTNNQDRNFAGCLDLGSKISFSGEFSKAISLAWKSQTSHIIQVTAEEARVYELKQPNELFTRLCKDKDVQKWLQSTYRGQCRPRFVTGYRTLLNAKVEGQHEHSTNISAEASIPVGVATGIDPTLTGLADVGFTVKRESRESGKQELECLGERIYAVCCRKVNLKFSVGGDFKGTSLDKENKWQSHATDRGETQIEAELVEAYLDDEEEDGVGKFVTFSTIDGEESFYTLPAQDEDQEDSESESEDENENENEDENGTG
jgi:hypothetical protein